MKKKSDSEDVLVAENGVLRAEVSLGRAKVEAMAEECHVMKRKLLEETKRRQVGAIRLILLTYFEPRCKLTKLHTQSINWYNQQMN